eukprot:GILK01008706.1.p1 GENE.GILK01008706.1~~GILK01008706.1.p1  ORF type:complete len:662 (-),score=112.76 GILK01008706.1:105-2090(-)
MSSLMPKKQCLWMPSEDRIKRSQLYRFMEYVREHHNFNGSLDYSDLWQWSTDNLGPFWSSVWQFCNIKYSQMFHSVLDKGDANMLGAKFFPGAKLNFAENLLRFRDDRVAIMFKDEVNSVVRITYRELYHRVARLAKSLRQFGIQAGDRIAGFMPNIPETIVAMLAATSVGAIWSSCSPDFGLQGVKDRFGQIQPRILFAADGYHYKGKRIDCLAKIAEIAQLIPSIEKVVIVPYLSTNPNLSSVQLANSILFDDFCASLADSEDTIEFEQLPFDHPVYIMYSSGTTGLPKCMVQGVGVLLNHMKEHQLHCDLTRDDVIFYFTTCGWMMWNWLVSSLATGASIVLYDGHPLHPSASVLWQLAQDVGVTVFGTSARYITAVKDEGVSPKSQFDLSSIRLILSTGSPLSVDGFAFVYSDIKPDVQLASISGGTDLNGCFALGCPWLPVYTGELQCRGLGLKVAVYNDEGQSVTGEKGELVCVEPFPSMPLFFWNDSNNDKYKRAYFDHFSEIWRHGDFAEITPNGGMIIYGRSDATLNPGGVRIGTAELYRYIETVPEIVDSVAIGQNWKDDVRVILFVKMKEGYQLTEALKSTLVSGIRKNVSPRHVPEKIIAVPDVPYTLNMKKVEIAVKQMVEGEPVQNRDALINPDCLDYFVNMPELKE